MNLQTHIAFGLFFGTLFYYFLNLDFSFVLLTGFAAFIPDIDLKIKKLSKKIEHRRHLHNLWVMFILIILFYLAFHSLILSFGIMIGFTSHLIADSFTVSGIYWLWPLGKNNKKYFIGGSYSMNTENSYRIEKIIQIMLFALSGFLLMNKEGYIIKEDIFSLEGILIVVIIIYVGFRIYDALDKGIGRAWRKSGL